MQEIHLQLLVQLILLEINDVLHHLDNQSSFLRLDNFLFHGGRGKILAHQNTFLVVFGQFLLELFLLPVAGLVDPK